MWSNNARRTSEATPTLALAAIHCADIEKARPSAASRRRKANLPNINGRSPSAIPLSIIAATTSGTSRSIIASSILKNGARIDCIL